MPHTADIRLSLLADTLEELFAEAARFVARHAGRRSTEPGRTLEVSIAARDTATLLADWINELLARSEIAHAALWPEAVTIADGSVTASLRAVPVTRWRCRLKAATYHDLRLEYRRHRWHAQVVCDV